MEASAILLRIDEVAQLLQISRSRAYGLASSGEFPVVKIGRQLRVPKEGFEKWVASLHSPAATPGNPVQNDSG